MVVKIHREDGSRDSKRMKLTGIKYVSFDMGAYRRLSMITDALFHIKHVPYFGFSAETVSKLRSPQGFEEEG
jgi:hypothetical protein